MRARRKRARDGRFLVSQTVASLVPTACVVRLGARTGANGVSAIPITV